VENVFYLFQKKVNAREEKKSQSFIPICLRNHRLVPNSYLRALHTLLGSLSNHDERDDDDVKWARKDWDENVVFEGKMKLKQWGCW